MKKGTRVSWKVDGYPDAQGVVNEDGPDDMGYVWVRTDPKLGEPEGGSLSAYKPEELTEVKP